MERKHNVDKINLRIEGVIFYAGSMEIHWCSDIGYGVYGFSKGLDGRLIGDSEYMDSNDDKAFIKKLMELVIEQLEIE